jgi:hypothetical protein
VTRVEAAIGIAALVIFVLVVAYVIGVALRKQQLLRRAGVIPMALRGGTDPWTLGVGRYSGDELWWYSALRPARRPTRTIRRGDLEISGQRGRRPEEQILPAGSVIVECHDDDAGVSLCLSAAAVTGFLSWLEASPPPG